MTVIGRRVQGPLAPHPGTGSMKVPCGRCAGCRVNRAEDWTCRLTWESDEWSVSSFVTLTYSDEQLPSDQSLDRRVLQLFFKRLRKSGLSFRYFACGEYGERFGRPHFHVIFFGLGKQHEQLLQDSWSLGLVDVRPFRRERARYCAQYMLKEVDPAISLVGRAKPFALMSKGLGLAYCMRNSQKILDGLRPLTVGGKPVATPRYFRKKLDAQDTFLAEQHQVDVVLNHGTRVGGFVALNDEEAYMKRLPILASIEASRVEAAKSFIAFKSLRGVDDGKL